MARLEALLANAALNFRAWTPAPDQPFGTETAALWKAAALDFVVEVYRGFAAELLASDHRTVEVRVAIEQVLSGAIRRASELAGAAKFPPEHFNAWRTNLMRTYRAHGPFEHAEVNVLLALRDRANAELAVAPPDRLGIPVDERLALLQRYREQFDPQPSDLQICRDAGDLFGRSSFTAWKAGKMGREVSIARVIEEFLSGDKPKKSKGLHRPHVSTR